MFFYSHVDAGLKTQDSKAIEPAENFKYLGSWISDSEHDFKARKASAWIALQQNEQKCGNQSCHKQQR